MRLANKIALITGAGSGIGRGIACRFAVEGALLVLSDIAEEGLRETAALIDEALTTERPEGSAQTPPSFSDKGGLAETSHNAFQTTDGAWLSPWGSFVVGDVSVRSDAERMVEAAITRWGRLDIVVNNAGITGSRRATLAHTTPDEEWERVMEVNVNGVFRVASAAIRRMLEQGPPSTSDKGGIASQLPQGGMAEREQLHKNDETSRSGFQGRGTIINIASAAGFVPFPARAAYNASKGAVISFTRALALDYAPNHIRVNAICPGMVETAMTRWRLDVPELRQQVIDMTPWGRIGRAEDIAAAAVYLASDEADFVTGHMLVIDGGWIIN
jgi:NAD(P)-dependent dehydrogenase (short-subunit alcohol dehydrogenase family)